MLVIKDLDFSYPRKPLLLEHISLELRQGHIYGLLGKNGAGKSTLLKNMMGLTDPVKGGCRYNGVPVTGRPVTVLEDIYFIAEELYVPSLTPAQFVANTAGFIPNSASPISTIISMCWRWTATASWTGSPSGSKKKP